MTAEQTREQIAEVLAGVDISARLDATDYDRMAAAIAAALPDPEQADRAQANYVFAVDHHARTTRERDDLRAKVARVRRALDDELANLADDGARLSHTVVRRIEAALDGAP